MTAHIKQNNMIAKFYEVRCDYCNRVINHYPTKKPTPEILKNDCAVVTPTKQFCSDECYGYYNHDRQEKQYLNLHPDGRIHHDTPKAKVRELKNTLPLFTPREQCLECYNWLSQEDVGEHDFPCCDDSYKPECRNYLYGITDSCPNQLKQ